MPLDSRSEIRNTMNKDMMLRIVILFLFLTPIVSQAQQAFSLKPIILGYHPYADPNNSIAPYRVGDDGTFATEPGLMLGYENYLITPAMGVKTHAGFFRDSGGKGAMLFHLGYRLRTHSDNQSITLSVGPSFFMRQSWEDVPLYEEQDFWNRGGSWDTRIVWFSGEVEMLYAITPEHRINVAFNHIAPQTFTFTVGYSYWLERMKKGRKNLRRRSATYKRSKRKRRR